MKHGLGAALEIEARTLLAASEMDEQLDDDFCHAYEVILECLNLQEAPKRCECSNRFSQHGGKELCHSLNEAMAHIKVVLKKWSPCKLAENVEIVAEVLEHPGVVVAVFNHLLLNEAFREMEPLHLQLAAHLPKCDLALCRDGSDLNEPQCEKAIALLISTLRTSSAS